MKQLSKEGFTLVELLAVITIMGILMLVAIPAVSRTIENSRRDTFLNTAKAYINAIKNAVSSDELHRGDTPISALGTGDYYYGFTTAGSYSTTATDLMEQGGKSSWGNADVSGYIVVHKTVEDGRTKYEYAIFLTDTQGRGISTLTAENSLRRASVVTSSSVTSITVPNNRASDKNPFVDDPNVNFKKDLNCYQIQL